MNVPHAVMQNPIHNKLQIMSKKITINNNSCKIKSTLIAICIIMVGYGAYAQGNTSAYVDSNCGLRLKSSDHYKAIQKILDLYSVYIDTNQIHINGYSLGGINTRPLVDSLYGTGPRSPIFISWPTPVPTTSTPPVDITPIVIILLLLTISLKSKK
jgi:hypothetical protein